jgi:hypothetical protein
MPLVEVVLLILVLALGGAHGWRWVQASRDRRQWEGCWQEWMQADRNLRRYAEALYRIHMGDGCAQALAFQALQTVRFEPRGPNACWPHRPQPPQGAAPLERIHFEG